MTVPVQTAYRCFKHSRTWNEWLELPITISNLPLSSQLAITVWDVSPTGGQGARGHAIPFGGTTVSLFDQDNTLQKGRQKCRLYRHKAADGFSSTTTPAVPPARKTRGGKGLSNGHVKSSQEEELQRLEKLFKKHEMGEIPRVDWLDKLVFNAVEKQRQLVETSARVSSKARRKLSTLRPEFEDDDADYGDDEKEGKDIRC